MRISRKLMLVLGLLGIPAVAAAEPPGPLRAGEAFELAVESDERPQLNASVAYDDATGIFLVAWQQGRRYFEQQQGDILAVRIDRTGKLLDARPLVLSRAPDSQEAPQVAFSSGVFLVAWQDFRSGRHWDVYGARVTPEGLVLDTNGIAIATQSGSNALPQVATADGGFLVVWQTRSSGHYQLAGAYVSAGADVSAIALRFGGSPLYGGAPALVRVDEGWHLAWNDEKSWSFANIITRRFAWLSGNPRRPAVASVQRAPSVHLGGEGGRFIAARSRALYVGAQVGGRGQRVWTGVLLDQQARFLPNPNSERPFGMSMWDPSHMIPIVPGSAAVDGMVAASVACGRYLLVARAAPVKLERGGNYKLLAARLDRDGRRLDDSRGLTVLHESPSPIANPASASGGVRHLLVFELHDVDGTSRLRARMVSDCQKSE